jgi:hypothetical protein
MKTLRATILLTLLFFINVHTCYANGKSSRPRKKIQRIARKISHYKTVDFGLVGFNPTLTKQYERFMLLSEEGTDAELVILTKHKSPKVRVYAFNILVSRKYKGIKAVVEKLVIDNAFFISRSGCMRGTERVNQYCLHRISSMTDEERNYVFSKEEIDLYKNQINTLQTQKE